uniref:Uncharacterized protein n=1 Tax=Glossina pallidipes TaxID=7398 RepID=A0A1B0A8K4_GLOPL
MNKQKNFEVLRTSPNPLHVHHSQVAKQSVHSTHPLTSVRPMSPRLLLLLMILLRLFINDEDLLSEELEVVLVAVVCAEYASVEVDNAASGDNGNTKDDDDNFAGGGNDDDNKDIFVFSTRSYEADGLEDDANGGDANNVDVLRVETKALNRKFTAVVAVAVAVAVGVSDATAVPGVFVTTAKRYSLEKSNGLRKGKMKEHYLDDTSSKE